MFGKVFGETLELLGGNLGLGGGCGYLVGREESLGRLGTANTLVDG